MKNIWIIVPLLASALQAFAENNLTRTEPKVISRGAHEQVWEYTTVFTDASGETDVLTNRFIQVTTGLNRWDPNTQQYVPASPSIQIVNGKGVIQGAQHKATFAGNANTLDGAAVNVEMPDGTHLVLQTIGIALTDNQNSVFLAEIKDSPGVLIGDNKIVYEDAFDSIQADIQITSSLAGIESDVILKEKIDRATIQAYGIDPASARLQVWHQVLQAPDATKHINFIKRNSGRVDLNENVAFQKMRISQGSAFLKVSNKQPLTDSVSIENGIPVAKEYTHIEGFDFLIESLPFIDVENDLNQLPAPQEARVINKEAIEKAFASRQGSDRKRPVSLARKDSDKPKDKAVAMLTRGVLNPAEGKSFVLDYVVLNSSLTNYVFKGDSTYYITNVVDLYGTTVLEGGAVIKFTNYTSLSPWLKIREGFDCRTSPYNPAFFTAKDDDSVGETISGSTGTPSGLYALYNLQFVSMNNVQVHDIQSRYSFNGVGFYTGTNHQAWNLQVFNCNRGIEMNTGQLDVQNALLYKTAYAFLVPGNSVTTINAEHLTIRSADMLFNYASGQTNTLNLTNCLVVGVTNGSLSGVYSNYVVSAASDTGIFSGKGIATNYLASGSPYRDAGTTNLSARMKSILKTTTTEPPLEITADFTSDTTLYPVVARDTDIPDLGYHYQPLDYIWITRGVDLNKTLILTNGVAVGVGGSSGTWVFSGAKFISEGSPTRMNRYVHPAVVQELPSRYGQYTNFLSLFNTTTANTVTPEIHARFTEFSVPANATGFRHFASAPVGHIIDLKDCWLRHPLVYVRSDVAYAQSTYLTNNLMDRIVLWAWEYGVGGNPVQFFAYNNLFYGGSAYLDYTNSAVSWAVYDNLFDNVALTRVGSTFLTNGNNGYIATTALAGGSGNVTVAAGDYQSGPLGRFYYPTSGTNLYTLVNAGSRNADAAGLYHYTTLIDQTKETNSVVNIGFHYVAVDSDGLAFDTDGDERQDYEEDPNGNGLVDSGETDLHLPNNGFDEVVHLNVFTPLK